jgi:capsular exopolysaccharide synthesis family protein
MTNPHEVSGTDPDRKNSLVESNQQTAIGQIMQPFGYAGAQESDESINLREYWNVVLKHKWTVIGIFAVAVIVTAVATFLTTPIYRATTIVQIEREVAKVVEFQDSNPSESAGPDFYQTQYELLKSRSLAKRVVDQMGVARLKTAIPEKNASIIEWIKGLLDSGKSLNPKYAAETKKLNQEEIKSAHANQLLASLTIEPVRSSRLVKVSFDSPDAQTAAKVANSVAQNFINVNMERKFESTNYAKSFLEERLVQVKDKLEKAERAMLEYARDNQIYNLGGEKGGTTASRNLEGFNEALSVAQQERIKAESLYRQLEAAHGGELPQVLESSIIKSLRETKVKLESEYQDKLGTFKPTYPAMLDLSARIAEVDVQLKKEKKVVSDSIKASYEAAKDHESLINEKFVVSKTEVLDLQTRSIQYNILQREADTNRQLYDGLLQRYKEVGVGADVGSNNIFVVDAAEVPKSPFKPDFTKNIILASILGLLLGVGLAFLFEHLDDTFKRSSDVEDLLGLSVIGLIPAAEELTAGISIVQLSIDDSRAGVVEAYRSVRTALQFSTEHGAPKMVAITSSEKGESKTTSSVGVGIQFAQFGSKVLIIDADLRNPSLHKMFGGDNQHGLTNILVGGDSPAKVTQNTPIANLYYISSGPLPPNPAELLSSSSMREMLDLAREKFDFIIIDSPPILGLADVLVIAKLVDNVILQIHSGSTTKTTVQAALKRLAAIRIRPLGCMLTRMRQGSHGYNYEYYYSYGAEPNSKKSDKNSQKLTT